MCRPRCRLRHLHEDRPAWFRWISTAVLVGLTVEQRRELAKRAAHVREVLTGFRKLRP